MYGSRTDLMYRLCLIEICIVVIIAEVCADVKPILQISETEIWEFSNVTLTCSCPETTTPHVATWTLVRPNHYLSFIIQMFNKTDKTCNNELKFVNITYTTYCKNVTTFELTLMRINRHENGYNWTCKCGFNPLESIPIITTINVPVKSVTLRLGNTDISKVTTIHVFNNSKTTLECSSTCARPESIITWYRKGNTSTNISNSNSTNSGLICSQAVLSFVPTLESQGEEFYCSANNKENEQHNSPKITVDVLYPPSVGQLPNVSVIEGKDFRISCNEVPGNPNKTNYYWSNRGNLMISKVKDLLISNVSRNNETFFTCTATNEMKPTFGAVVNGVSNKTFYLMVFYKPNITSIMFQANSSDGVEVLDQNVSVIENESFNINCIANSKPRPYVNWTGPVTSQSHELKIREVKREENGTYVCTTTNKMTAANITEHGKSQAHITLNILYPPEMEKLQNVVVTEGSTFRTSCQGKNGNPASYDCEWTWNGQEIPVRNQTLMITNVSKTNDTIYRCKVNNTMIAIDGEPKFGYVSDQFHLNVTYKAFVQAFYLGNRTHSTNITVHEKVQMIFNCTVGGNPKPRMTLKFKNQNLSDMSWSNVLTFKHIFPSCHSSGSYKCEGINQINNGQPASKSIYIQVKCTPLPTKKLPSVIEIASKVNDSTVLNLTTIAFPEPGPTGFTWYKSIKNSSWVVLQKSERYLISSSNLESNLTIRSSTEAEYGRYMLKVNNSVGILVQNYTLRPEDVPSKPTHFMILNESVTETTVTVSWRKGFNGGYKQTFILRYYKLTTKSITSITIYETNENVMEYTIGNLSIGSMYWLELRTRNVIGENMFPLVLYFTTAGTEMGEEDKMYTNSIGTTLGIVFGIIIFIALITASSVFLYKRRRKHSAANKDNHPSGRVHFSHSSSPYEDLDSSKRDENV